MRFSEDVRQKILYAISLGASVEDAARAAGIGESTFYLWQEKGRKARAAKNLDDPFARFLEEIESARSRGKCRLLEVISRASALDWKAAAWRLERSYPQEFGRFLRTEVSGPGGGPIETKRAPEDFSDAELAAILSGEEGSPPSKSKALAIRGGPRK